MVCQRRIDSVRTNALLAEARLKRNLAELVWNQGRVNQLLSLFLLRDYCQDPANLSARAVSATDGGRELRVQWTG